MSSDFAFSETTPLRQTDFSNAISATTAAETAATITTEVVTINNNNSRNNLVTTATGNNNNSSNNNNNIISSSSDINNDTNINNNLLNSINNNNNNNNNNNSNSNRNINSANNNNNNNINNSRVQLESRLNPNYNRYNNRLLNRNITEVTTTTAAAANNNNNIDGKMDTNRKIIRKSAFDFILLLCVALPILLYYLLGEPYKRGFFCDDQSLMYQFHGSTVKLYMLYLMGLVLPLVIIVSTEYFRGKNMPTYRFMNCNVPSWIVEPYKHVGVYVFGAAAQQLVVDIAKYSVGRLRPHFFNVCQPILADGSTCANSTNWGHYIENYTCQGNNFTKQIIKNVHLSFPSGHASFSAFAMIYCMIYLQYKMNWRGSKILKHFIQLLLFIMTWFTALSRISDNKHHWSDVLSGGAIGIIFAIVVSQWIGNFNVKKFELPRTRQDIAATNLYTTTPMHQQQYTTNHNNQQQQNHNQNSSNGHNNHS